MFLDKGKLTKVKEVKVSSIDELLKNEKVEWKRLGEVIERYSEKARNCKEINLVYTVSKEYGIISSIDYWTKTASSQRISYKMYSEDTSNYNIIRKNMFAYNPARLNIGSISCLFDKESGLLSPMYIVFKIDENILLPKYLLYFLKQEKILKQIDDMKELGARFRFDFDNWKKILIPIPSIETQKKIVEILDKFTNYVTELQAELQAELQNRTKQYEYYRDMLLSEEYLNKLMNNPDTLGEVYSLEYKKLGEVCEILDNKRKPIKKSERILGEYPYYGANGIQDYVEDYIFDGTYILMGEDGSVINKDNTPVLHWIYNKKIWVNNHAHVLSKLNKKYNLKYVYYYLSRTNVSDIVKGTPPKINQESMKNLLITIPPLFIQNKVVEVLDKFQSLLSETQGLLPEEINKRQKQYEYYREKLLTFDTEFDKQASKQASKQANNNC